MSSKAMNWALDQRLANPFQQIVLQAIGDWADPKGRAHDCELTYLADAARLAPASVRKHLTELREASTIDLVEKFNEKGEKVYDITLHLGEAVAMRRAPLTKEDKKEKPAPPIRAAHLAGSNEAKAVRVLHEIVGRTAAFFKICRRPDGSVMFPRDMTPQLAALGSAPERSDWVRLTHQQAGAWEGLMRIFFEQGAIRQRLQEGSLAPWAWPPRKDGTLSPTGPPPDTLMTDQDVKDFQ